MKHLIRLRPSPAMVIACLALGIALGGTSYAAIKLPKNSVGTKQLKKNAVTSPKVKNNAITGADVLESSLGQVPSAASATNATNATNATTATNATNAGTLDGLDSVNVLPGGILPSGKTIRGRYVFVDTAVAAGEGLVAGFSYVYTLASVPTAHFIPAGGVPPAQCPGTVLAPAAQPGHLCVYSEIDLNTTPALTELTKYGFDARGSSLAAGQYGSRGQWAVTAP